MAQLTAYALTLEISFDSVKNGWIQYAVYFKWNGIPVINESILRAGPEYLGKADALWANDDGDSLIGTIEEVLEKREPVYWEPTEPDVTIAFFPGWEFPFMKSHLREPVDMSNREFFELIKKGEFNAAEHHMKYLDHSMPKEYIQIIAKVDTLNFTPTDEATDEEATYGPEGISLQMVVEDRELYDFLQELKQEYQAFLAKHKDEINYPDRR